MPKISIITTTYKHQDFINKTIESILSQTFTDWELLIGDDSPDNKTWNIIANYVNKFPNKIKAWHHSPNKGIVDNMNFLVEKVSQKSEYIAFLEGDDLFTPNNLEEKIKIFEKHSDIALVYSDFRKIDEKGNFINGNKKLFFGKIINNFNIKEGINKIGLLKLLNLGNPIQSFGLVTIKKEILFKYFPFINLDEKNTMFGPFDYSLWLKILPENIFYFTSKKLFYYRLHGNNFVKNVNVMYYQLSLIYEKIKNDYKNDSNIENICNFFLENNNMMLNYLKGDKINAIKCGIKSLKYNKSKFLIERLGVIFLSIMPNFINKIIYKKN